MTDLLEKSTGSTLTATEWNVLKDKLTDSADTISTKTITISGAQNKLLSPIGVGSPTVWGQFQQIGSGATSAGSIFWVVYGTAFVNPPQFTVTSYDDSAPVSLVGSPVLAGSTHVISEGASQRFSWIATGL